MKLFAIDPDTKKSGGAMYEDGKLTGLLNFTLSEYIEMLPLLAQEGAILVIEDANLINAIYADKVNKKPRNLTPQQWERVKLKKAQSVGMIKRQCSVMIELAHAYDIKEVVTYKPRQGNWAGVTKTVNNKQGVALLKKHTGWGKVSNNETRSAAFFGWLHLNKGV